MSRPLSASSNPPARPPCPSGPGPTRPRPAAAPDGFAVEGSEGSEPWPASGDWGAGVPAEAGAGTAPVAGGVGAPWLTEGAGPGVRGAATCPGTWP